MYWLYASLTGGHQMKRFKNILCVVPRGDTGKLALQRAVSLAESNQADLTVVGVMAPLSIGMGMPDGGPISAELQTVMLRTCREELNALVSPQQGRVKIKTGILIGVQFLEIIRDVIRNGRDLVIKVPEIQDWLDNLVGSEDMHLLRKCPCPVWLVKPAAQKSFRRVLAAVDVNDAFPSKELGIRRLLNQQIIEMASSIALSDFAELHLTHVWRPIGENAMHDVLSYFSSTEVDAYIANLKHYREAGLLKLMEAMVSGLETEVLNYLKPESHLLRGNARSEIPTLAKELEADLIVMGTVARTGIPGFITGNTAESILGQINCSVLAVKPQGFVTPVTLT